VYDPLNDYILFNNNYKKQSIPIVKEEINKNIVISDRDSIEMTSIRLINCDKNESYKVSVFEKFDHYQEEPLIFSTDYKFPNNISEIYIKENINIVLFYERKQYLKFIIEKENENKKYVVLCPTLNIFTNMKDELEFTFNKEKNEKLVINSKLINFSIRMEIDVKLKNLNILNTKGNYFYLVNRINIRNNDKIKKVPLYYSEEIDIYNKNEYQFKTYSNFFNLFDPKNNRLNTEKRFCLEFFKISDTNNSQEILLKEITLPYSLGENKININLNNDISVEMKVSCDNAYSLAQYLRYGLEINMSISIDFTASNGNIKKKGSLHQRNSNSDNPYEKAIKVCGEIIAQYDNDKIYPVFGYGALLPNQNIVSHCFNLNLKEDPNIETIEKVLETYYKVLPKLIFKSPTYFAPTIKKTIDIIRSKMKNSNQYTYDILLILTDGKLDDMKETISLIVEGSELPLSIVIIGIGKANFDIMKNLDSDNSYLIDYKGRKAARDIVQFVPFSKYENNLNDLAEAIYEEIPKQIVNYFMLRKIKPEDLKK